MPEQCKPGRCAKSSCIMFRNLQAGGSQLAVQQHEQPPPDQQGDVLAKVPLPSFSQRFSALHSRPGTAQHCGPAAVVSSGEGLAIAAATGPMAAVVATADPNVSAAGRKANTVGLSVTPVGPENQPPMPRPLPPIFAARPTVSPGPSASTPVADFQWRPCSAST